MEGCDNSLRGSIPEIHISVLRITTVQLAVIPIEGSVILQKESGPNMMLNRCGALELLRGESNSI